jgi:hypothetical protein
VTAKEGLVLAGAEEMKRFGHETEATIAETCGLDGVNKARGLCRQSLSLFW